MMTEGQVQCVLDSMDRGCNCHPKVWSEPAPSGKLKGIPGDVQVIGGADLIFMEHEDRCVLAQADAAPTN